MARRYRRVTKRENAAAWRARRYTAAAPGKFTRRSVTISFRQYQQRAHGGVTIENQIKERRKTRSSLDAHKARITKARVRELSEYADDDHVKLDNALIKKYIKSGHDYHALKPSEQDEFRDLFHRYPEDLVRKWLDSSEESRAMRRRWAAAA